VENAPGKYRKYLYTEYNFKKVFKTRTYFAANNAASSSCEPCAVYSGGARFESRLGHRLS
jgi:hypothetical protein